MNPTNPTNEPDDIRALRENIEETRGRIAAEVEEIGDRLTPEHASHVAKEKLVEAKDRTIGRAKTETAEAGRTLGRVARDNPIPSAMMAVGAGWLLYEAFGPDRPTRAERVVRQRADAARASMSDAVETAGTRARDAADRMSAAAERARGRAGEVADEGRYRAQRAWVRTQDGYDANPLAFGAAAMVAGVGLAMLLPRTRREDRLMGERRAELTERAREAAHDARDVALESAREGARAARDTAEAEAEQRELP